MHFLIEKGALKVALDSVRAVIPRATTFPILGNVLIEVKDGNLYVTATDLDTEAVCAGVDVQIYKPGSICVPGHIFSTAVNKLPGGAQLEFELSDGVAQCRAGRINFDVPTLPAGDFPRLTMDGERYELHCKADDALKALKQASYCQGREETRYYLNGVCINPTQDGLEFVATDGHRLSRYLLSDHGAIDGTLPQVIVPTRAVTEFVRMLEKSGDVETVKITGTDAKIRLTRGAVTVTSKLVDGTFPDYKRIIPPRHDFMATLNREVFKDAIDRVSTFTSDKERTIGLFFAPDSVEIKARTAELGRGHEEVMIDYDGPEFLYGINAGYMLEHLSNITGEDVYFFFDPQNPDRSPILLTGKDEFHEGLLMGVKTTAREY